MKRRILLCLLALSVTAGVVLTGSAEAFACGALTPPDEYDSADVSMKAQKALIHLRADTVDMHLQVTATTRVDAFAWFFPVAPGAQLAEGDPELFDELGDYTNPTVRLTYPDADSGGGIGCGDAAAARAGGPEAYSGGVDVVDAGRIGDYTFQIVEANVPSDLVTWLDENGYHTPEETDVLVQRYVNQGMNFAAVKLAADVEQVDQEPDTLVVSSPRNGDALVYPLLLSKLSASTTSEVLVYTLATKRYLADSPFINADLQQLADRMATMHQATGDADYEQTIDEITGEQGGRLAVTEFAVELEESGRCDADTPCPDSLQALLDSSDASFLTRMHLRVPRARLADLEIYPAAENEQVLPEAAASLAGSAAATVLLLLLGLPLVRLGRRT